MTEIKKLMDNIRYYNRPLRTVVYYISKPYFAIKNAGYVIKMKKRMENPAKSRYGDLLKYKGKHEGERCFIIATGPSLKLADVEMLRNEYTFSMNSITKMFHDTDWRPTYYCIQDLTVYKKLSDEIEGYFKDADNVFVADVIARERHIPSNFHEFSLNGIYNRNGYRINKWFVNFSEDCCATVFDGYTITYSIIQLAVYMGFKKIYLLGADCSYKKGGQNHFAEYSKTQNYHDIDTAYDRNIVMYETARKYAGEHGIEIYNVTRGGKLEVFTRKNLEDILKEQKNLRSRKF